MLHLVKKHHQLINLFIIITWTLSLQKWWEICSKHQRAFLCRNIIHYFWFHHLQLPVKVRSSKFTDCNILTKQCGWFLITGYLNQSSNKCLVIHFEGSDDRFLQESRNSWTFLITNETLQEYSCYKDSIFWAKPSDMDMEMLTLIENHFGHNVNSIIVRLDPFSRKFLHLK